jgi:hypothetical protein
VKRLEVRDCLVQDRVYRQYRVEKHKAFHSYAEVKKKDQRAYWNWRNSDPDHDHDGR